MENKQFKKFKNDKSSEMMALPEQTYDMDDSCQIYITSTDHHIIKIVTTYINKLPDIHTKKHLARIIINFIMKSAKL